jgi:plasmid stability protein
MRARFWLIISVAFNLFLGGFLYVAKEQLKEPVVPVAPGVNNVIVRTNVLVRRENFTWDLIQSTNYATLIKNLRIIGCPEETIRDIVTSDIDRIYARRKLTEVVYPNYQWWKSTPDPDLAQAANDKLQSLETERRELLTSLLGPGWNVESKEEIAARGGVTLTGPILGDLPAQVKKAVLDIMAASQLKIEAYQEQQRLQGNAIDPVQMARLREEPLVQLASVLGSDAYEEFVLRYSPAAQQLREMMRTLNLTPDLFRELFSALSGIIGQPVYFYAGSDPDTLKQQQALATQAEAVIKATLGADVYAGYQLNQDSLYRSSQALVQQLNLPANLLVPIYQINRATQAEMDRIRNDDTLSNDEKIEALSQTQVQEQQSLEQLLGADAFQRWLQAQGQK